MKVKTIKMDIKQRNFDHSIILSKPLSLANLNRSSIIQNVS